MSVKQQPLINGEVASSNRPGAVFRRAQIRQARGWFERLSAIAVLLLSLLGSVLAWAGGFVKFAAAPMNPIAWGLGLLSQAILTFLQWMYRAQGFAHPVYLVSLGIDVALTVLGFGPIVAPWLTARMVEARWFAAEGAAITAWGVVAVSAFAMAWYPEDRLID